MSSALKFSKSNNFLSLNDFKIITNHIKNCNLPNNIKKYFFLKDVNKIISFMINDKKNSTNKINLILLKKIGTPLINKKFTKEKLKIFLDRQLRD